MSSPETVPPERRVIAERRRRGWSARTAAQVAHISNTTWSEFERTGVVTDTVRRGVAEAFGWSTDWPECEAPTEPSGQAAVLEAIDSTAHQALAQALEGQRRIIALLEEILAELRAHRVTVEPDAGVDAVLDRLGKAVEMLVAQRLPPPSAQAGS